MGAPPPRNSRAPARRESESTFQQKTGTCFFLILRQRQKNKSGKGFESPLSVFALLIFCATRSFSTRRIKNTWGRTLTTTCSSCRGKKIPLALRVEAESFFLLQVVASSCCEADFSFSTCSSCRKADFQLAVRVTWDPARHPHTVLAAP